MAKKIGAIISLSIIGILILVTVIMSNVYVNHAEPDKIYVQYSSNHERVVEDNHCDKIVSMINNSSKESSLTALFNSTINDKPVIVNNSTKVSSIPSTSDFYVTFVYNNPQKLMNGNKEFKDENGKPYYYYALTFTVSNVDEIGEVKVYISPYYEADGETARNDFDVYNKYYRVTANFSDIYDYLVEKGYNK